MPFDITALQQMQTAFELANDAEFTKSMTGSMNGHEVRYSPEDQKRVNREFTQNILSEIKKGMTTFSDSIILNAIENQTQLGRDVSGSSLADADHPLKGHEIAQALGKAIDIIKNYDKVRDDFLKDFKADLQKMHRPEADDVENMHIGEYTDKKFGDLAIPQEKDKGFPKRYAKLLQHFGPACDQIDSADFLSPESKKALKRLVPDKLAFDTPGLLKVCGGVLETCDMSSVLETLRNPDEFTLEEKAGVLSAFLTDLNGRIGAALNTSGIGDFEDGPYVIHAIIAHGLFSKFPEFAAAVRNDPAALENMSSYLNTLDGTLKKAKKISVPELSANMTAMDVTKHLLEAARDLAKEDSIQKAKMRPVLREQLQFTDDQCEKFDIRDFRKCIEAKEGYPAKSDQLMKDLIASLAAEAKRIRDSRLHPAVITGILNRMAQKPGTFANGPFTAASAALDEIPTNDWVEAFLDSSRNSLIVLDKIRDFANRLLASLKKFLSKNGHSPSDETTKLARSIALHILANLNPDMQLLLGDRARRDYLKNLAVMANGLAQEGPNPQEAEGYRETAHFIRGLLARQDSQGI